MQLLFCTRLPYLNLTISSLLYRTIYKIISYDLQSQEYNYCLFIPRECSSSYPKFHNRIIIIPTLFSFFQSSSFQFFHPTQHLPPCSFSSTPDPRTIVRAFINFPPHLSLNRKKPGRRTAATIVATRMTLREICWEKFHKTTFNSRENNFTIVDDAFPQDFDSPWSRYDFSNEPKAFPL